MFEIIDPTSSEITLAQNFDYDALGADGKLTIIVEAREVNNPERKSRCEVIVTNQVQKSRFSLFAFKLT
jgi:hypothetical protein